MKISRIYADIDLSAAKHNMDAMYAKLKPGTKMVAVIKTNAYGHGDAKLAEALEDLPYLWGYAVATAEEAVNLIEEGRKKPFLILGMSFPEQYETIVSYGIRPAICDFETAQELSKIAVQQNQTVKIHIKIDTGMSRIGFQVTEESADEIAQIAGLSNIVIEGMFTHFAKADEYDKTSTYQQIKLYQKMDTMLKARGVDLLLHHCSNSAGIVEIPEANMDMVRAGITLYGLWPSEEVDKSRIDLRPVMALKSSIAFIKELDSGRQISYGGTYTTDSTKRIATIPVGYGDGYCRGLSNKGYVLIHGKKAPICGRVCMDQFMVDISDIPEANKGDAVTLLGKDGDLTITMEELGELSGRFNYEFASLITPRVPRVYHY